MSLYLAIDTATDMGGVAVGEPGRVLVEVTFTQRRHASVLMPAVEETLRLADATMSDLSGIVVGDGPGSFTGLRIGLATVKGMLAVRDALELRVAPSLMAAAWNAMKLVAGPVAVLYDAYRGEIFGAIYAREGRAVRELRAPVCCTIEEFVTSASGRPAVAVGDGAVLYGDRVREWIGRAPIGPPLGGPRASALLELMTAEGCLTIVSDPDAFEPNYGRQAAAQDRWEEVHGRQLPDSPGQRS